MGPLDRLANLIPGDLATARRRWLRLVRRVRRPAPRPPYANDPQATRPSRTHPQVTGEQGIRAPGIPAPGSRPYVGVIIGPRRGSRHRAAVLLASVVAVVLLVATPVAVRQLAGAGTNPAPARADRTANQPSTQPTPPEDELPGAVPTERLNPPGTGSPLTPTVPAPAPTRLNLDDEAPATPVIKRIPTTKNVVFVTVDDGAIRDPAAPKLLNAAKVPSTLFLVSDVIGRGPAYFRQLRDEDASLQAHTKSHRKLAGLSESQQRAEVCGSADQLRRTFGEPPSLFRPPYGSYDDTTLRVARGCGIRATVLWEASMINGELYVNRKRFDPNTNPLRPGMILLMHFTPHFEHDFRRMMTAVVRSGYAVGDLTDYLGRTPLPPLPPGQDSAVAPTAPASPGTR